MANLDKTMFREYDIRGLVQEDQLNPQSVAQISKGIGSYLRGLGITKIVIGYDSRSSSPFFHDIAIKELSNSGFEVVDLGMVLVPMFYFAQYEYSCPGGVYISASHNPASWNGFKIANDYSSTLLGEEIKKLYNIIVSENFVEGKGSIKKENVLPLYQKNILEKGQQRRFLKIVIDAGNATAGPLVPTIFRSAGFVVEEIYCDLDPTFPNHEPNPSAPENKKDLAKKVVEIKADLGIALDTDGDRLGVVDDLGNIVEADQYLTLLSRDLLESNPGAKIIFDVKSGQGLIDDIKSHGGMPIMWKTGHSYIKAKLRQEKALLAGELSGHVFYAENHGYDDAVFAAFKLASYLSRQSDKLSKLLSSIPQYFSTPTLNAPCSDTIKYNIVENLIKEFKQEYEVIDINGARVVFSDGWGLVRASSNLPVLVLRFEAKSKEGLDKIMAIFKEKMNKYPEIGLQWNEG